MPDFINTDPDKLISDGVSKFTSDWDQGSFDKEEEEEDPRNKAQAFADQYKLGLMQ